jgi:hypothetical protein
MTIGSAGMSQARVYPITKTLVAGVTPEIDLMGGTLVGVLCPEITSTTFTITVSKTTGGTFRTVKDPLSSGTAITYTVGSTSAGYFPISPATTAGFRFCKLNFDQSETPDVDVMVRSCE